MDEVIAQALPESLCTFIGEACGLPVRTLRAVPPDELPATAQRLLAHQRDMTSTLAEFHGSELRVEVIQQTQSDDCYLREVFLRTLTTDAIVEYGVIGIALPQFTPEQRHEIASGRTPLGGLLHRFGIEFVSAPIGFFALPALARTTPALTAFAPGAAYGRFNHLATPTGEPLAWIMEILPPDSGR